MVHTASGGRIKFISTKGRSSPATFAEAVLSGLAPDGGLYLPDRLPRFDREALTRLSRLSFSDLSFEIARSLVGKEIASEALRRAVDSFGFAPLLRRLDGLAAQTPIWALELFHGPSLAFKDFGARFMASLLPALRSNAESPLTILVATSGDTGSAVAMGFHGTPGVRVVILYPSGQVTELQEMQLTALGGNVEAYRVEGTFDDCQRMVKAAFQDEDLRNRLALTSANSINLARLIPQAFYYFYAWGRLGSPDSLLFSVPSGNFGNLCAGLMARRMGLPVRFTAAVNRNDVVPECLRSGEYRPRPSVRTLSSAMDVGDPSNWERILSLYDGDLDSLRRDLTAHSFNDTQTLAAISEVYRRTGHRLDPHAAVAYLGLLAELERTPEAYSTGVFLATAHPAKFPEALRAANVTAADLPERLSRLGNLPRLSQPLPANAKSLKAVLLED